ASGPHSALPHPQPSASILLRYELLLIDMGAALAGYARDMTRVLFLGRPGSRVKRIYNAGRTAPQRAIEAVRPRVTAARIDAAARRSLQKKGLDKAFVPSTGHGLGLEIHEPPRLGKSDKTCLQEAMAITIEPGVYL